MITSEVREQLMSYIKHIDDSTESLTIKDNPTNIELILWCMTCLQEECWELASEIRKLTKMSFSQKKVDGFVKENLEDEFVDVYIVLLLLARRLWIKNLDQAVKRKIWKNKARGY